MQSLAILQDSVRELKSRSLFWVTLSISAVVSIALFGTIGFDEQGWYILGFSTNESTLLREGTPAARALMSWLFGGVLMWWWLTWGAIIVALIVTAGTIPEFVSSGAIDLILSKPISRARVFLIKIAGALMFTIATVSVTVAIAYVLLGMRFGMWFHHAWLAVPLVALQFLYLLTVMSVVGLITRSALAGLLATLFFWGLISVVQFASNQMDKSIAEMQRTIQLNETRIAEIRGQADSAGRDVSQSEQSQIRRIESRMEPPQTLLESIRPWQTPLHVVELCVPKTGDIQKIVATQIDAPTFQELMMALQGFDPDEFAAMTGIDDEEMIQDMQETSVAGAKAVREVEPLTSIGSSLMFVSLVLGFAVWIFSRRDF